LSFVPIIPSLNYSTCTLSLLAGDAVLWSNANTINTMHWSAQFWNFSNVHFH